MSDTKIVGRGWSANCLLDDLHTARLRFVESMDANPDYCAFIAKMPAKFEPAVAALKSERMWPANVNTVFCLPPDTGATWAVIAVDPTGHSEFYEVNND